MDVCWEALQEKFIWIFAGRHCTKSSHRKVLALVDVLKVVLGQLLLMSIAFRMLVYSSKEPGYTPTKDN